MEKNFTSISQCKDIVINNDIDGLLSGAFLKSVYGCNTVGMTNSKDKVLWKKGYEQKGHEVFIDFTAYGQCCIDQHIHPIKMANVLNPNFDREVYAFKDYKSKFPFSTYIYILYLAALDGKDVKGFIPINWGLMQDLVYRADGVLKNAALYGWNVKSWSEWMLNNLEGNPNKERFEEFFYNILNYDSVVDDKYKNIERYLGNTFGFKKEELPFNTKDGDIFFQLLKLDFKWDDFVLDERAFRHTRTTIRTMDEFKELVQNTNLFSYAFIYGPFKKDVKNFSYTEVLLM